jgi:hypothetical protein
VELFEFNFKVFDTLAAMSGILSLIYFCETFWMQRAQLTIININRNFGSFIVKPDLADFK